jgi:hypothetical protein
MIRIALVLHGKLGSWLVAASELRSLFRVDGSNASSGDDGKRYRSASSSTKALRAFAGFTHSTLWRHVVLANREAGATVRVVIHSWSPEVGDVLDSLYKPAASAHEPPHPHLDKVASQHLSMSRALALLDGLQGPQDDLIMVSRLDLLLFTHVPLAALATAHRAERQQQRQGSTSGSSGAPSRRDVLFLPHTCVPSRLRLPTGTWPTESRVLRRTCSGTEARLMPTGRRMLPAQLSRYQAGAVRSLEPQHDFTLFVLDYFFVGTPRVARSFAALAHSLPHARTALQARFRRQLPPQWAHLYWAQHVTDVLKPAGVPIRFVLTHEVHFSLARFWRFGADCLTRVRRSGEGNGGGGAVGSAGDSTGDGIGDGTDGDGDEAWRGFRNVTRFARSLRGVGGKALATSALAEQCPRSLESGALVLCPWFSQACAARAAATLAYADDAGRFQLSAGLPPRQLMGAERCVTPACLAYEGTARKRRRSEHHTGRSRST